MFYTVNWSHQLLEDYIWPWSLWKEAGIEKKQQAFCSIQYPHDSYHKVLMSERMMSGNTERERTELGFSWRSIFKPHSLLRGCSATTELSVSPLLPHKITNINISVDLYCDSRNLIVVASNLQMESKLHSNIWSLMEICVGTSTWAGFQSLTLPACQGILYQVQGSARDTFPEITMEANSTSNNKSCR